MLRFLLIVVLFAVATYVVVRLLQQRRGLPPQARTRPVQPPRPFGPDDDPDFLRDLDRKRRHPEDPDTPTG